MSGTKTLVIEADQPGTQLSQLLDVVEHEGRTVHILRQGKPVAELRSLAGKSSSEPLAVHPELKATFIAKDAFAPATEDEWPEEFR